MSLWWLWWLQQLAVHSKQRGGLERVSTQLGSQEVIRRNLHVAICLSVCVCEQVCEGTCAELKLSSSRCNSSREAWIWSGLVEVIGFPTGGGGNYILCYSTCQSYYFVCQIRKLDVSLMFLGTRDMNSRIKRCQVWFKLSTDTSLTTISADLAWSQCLNFWAVLGIKITERLQLQIGLPDKIRLESEKLQLIRTASTVFRDARTSTSVPFHTEHIKAARSIVWISAEAEA